MLVAVKTSLPLSLLALAACGDAPDNDVATTAATDVESCRAVEDRYIPRFEALGERGEALVAGVDGDPAPADMEAALELQSDLRALQNMARVELEGCTGPKRDLKGLYGDA